MMHDNETTFANGIGVQAMMDVMSEFANEPPWWVISFQLKF